MRTALFSVINITLLAIAILPPVLASDVVLAQYRPRADAQSTHELSRGDAEYKAVMDFLEKYHRAAEGDVAGLREFYAAKVLYYDRGYVDRSAIISERKSIAKRYPTRKYRLLTDKVHIYVRDPYYRNFDVTFENIYEVNDGEVTKTGHWRSEVKVQFEDGKILIYDENGGRVKSD